MRTTLLALLLLASTDLCALPFKTMADSIQSFVVLDASGGKIDVDRLKGKVIFVNFWSLTCVPCKEEMPTISNMRNHYLNDSNFYVLPVDLDRNFKGDLQYFKDHNISLNVYSPGGVVPQMLFKGELPTTAVIDKHGRIVMLKQGEDKYDTPVFFHAIDSLLAQ